MNLFILTSATDLTAAAVTSASDVAPLAAAPEVVVGDSEPITLKFLDSANNYAAWSGEAGYSVALALGSPTPQGLEVYALDDGMTAIANGWSGRLPLTSSALVSALAQAIGCRPRQTAALFFLQVTVTDADGKRETFAQVPFTVRSRVWDSSVTPPPAGAAYYTQAESDARYVLRNPASGAYRFQNDGTGGSVLQLLNGGTGKFHTIFISGAAGSERLAIGPADASAYVAPTADPVSYRFASAADGTAQLQLLNQTTGFFHTIFITGAAGAEALAIGPAGS
ncbi:MAG TPA: hypothetical protein VGE76_10195 [Opitutaceae bacterium]